MKTTNKILSLVLAVIMIVCTMPMAFAEGKTYEVGDIIQFGSYPQSKVIDEALVAELNALAPEWDDWTSYGYYTGTGSEGSMKQGDWMRYVDIKHDGERYRGVKFTQYRPYYTYLSSSYNVYQDNNGYNTNTVYWFKFESIDWRVLDPSTGLVMCETIIDSQPYSNTIYSNGGGTYGYFNDASYKNYASDYETSSIRKWLNEDFYNTAFTDSEKKEISTTTLNNDGYYTSNGTTGYEKLDSNETKDKIFLLSYNEVRNSNFGFSSDQYDCDTARFGKGSDYAQSQGLYVYRSSGSTYNGNSYWLLRSPCYSDNCCCVNYIGYSHYYFFCSVFYTYIGVRPALRFNRISDIGQSEHQHNYSAVVTNPTCTAQGYTTYTCECGYSYEADYVKANGHSFTNYISDGTATCVTDGKLIAKCDNCNATDSKPEKGTHKFSEDFITDVEATCTKEGEKSRHCIYCSEVTDKTSVNKIDHNYNIITVNPTCTDRGHKIYTCNCGDNFDETIPAKGHSFNGSACTDCGYNRANDCSCNCHKGGLMSLIWKIINLFNKLLKKNPVCACGAAHY